MPRQSDNPLTGAQRAKRYITTLKDQAALSVKYASAVHDLYQSIQETANRGALPKRVFVEGDYFATFDNLKVWFMELPSKRCR